MTTILDDVTAKRKKKPQNAAQKKDKKRSSVLDRCQTPPYAVDMIIPYLPSGAIIWEPAAGEGYIARKLAAHGFMVQATDLLTGTNYFETVPAFSWDVQVTNCPFSVKLEWIERAYYLGKPFAVLAPLDLLVSQATPLFIKYGIEVVSPNKRIDFKMPFKGWNGDAQFASVWFTHGLNIGSPLTMTMIDKVRPTDTDPVNTDVPADSKWIQLDMLQALDKIEG